MTTDIVPYVASSVIILWGIIHIVRTGKMTRAYQTASVDNRRIMTMGWVTQGLTLVFLGLLVMLVRYIYGGCPFTYPATVVMLLVMAGWTAMTGSRTSDRFLRISPVVEVIVAILTLYSELLLIGIL